MAGTTDQLVKWVTEIGGAQYDRAEHDVVVAAGEQITSGLLALALQAIGVPARSFLGWQMPLATDGGHGRARIMALDATVIRDCLEQGQVVIAAGFQGLAPGRRISTLGRGGSDTSAVALAAALGAERCDIFTDVDGVYTTDPRIVTKARKLDRVTYEEMLEMASQGAKVLQTRSVALAMQHGVRVQVLSSFDERPGTLVVDEGEIVEQQVVSGIAYSRDEAKVTLVGVADRPGVAAAIFGPLAECGINVDMIVQNVSADGKTTDLTFTVGRGRSRAHHGDAGDDARAARLPADRRRRRGGQDLGDRGRHALPRRHRPGDVPNAGRPRHQHPGDLDLGDQDQHADRRGLHRAGAARAAHGLRPRRRVTDATADARAAGGSSGCGAPERHSSVARLALWAAP